jgi:CRP-like cAMP-binding protein
MAGTNQILKADQVLFRAGDKSDGMYIVRRGELAVFLEKDGDEVELAKVSEGGMVGEMALFDQKPRSASVRASRESEVSHITTADFEKLMKQIPRWFVSLMTSLSTRLRQTNERLQVQENEAKAPEGVPGRMRNLKRMINIMGLIISRDAIKDGKDWSIRRPGLEEALVEQFGEPSDRVKALIDQLIREQIFVAQKSSVLGLPNRGALTQLSQSLMLHIKSFPGVPCFSDAQRAIMNVMEKVGSQSPYHTLTISLTDLDKEARKMGLTPSGWSEAVKIFAKTGEEIRLVKTSGGEGLSIRKKELSAFIKFQSVLHALHQAKII